MFVSYGSREVDPANPQQRHGRGPFGGDPQANTEALKQAGVNSSLLHFSANRSRMAIMATQPVSVRSVAVPGLIKSTGS